MDRNELRKMVAQLLQEMEQKPAPDAPAEAVPCAECLPDIAQEDLRSQYLVEQPENKDAFLALKKRTPARIGTGRCGSRYLTRTVLRFRADHAAAQDSVFSTVYDGFWKEHGWSFVQTLCRDKDEYLTRPDLGRRFGEEAQNVIRSVCGENPKVLLVIGDGLSSAAVEKNAPDCAAAIRQGLKNRGIELGGSLFIQYCRVGAMDHIGDLTGAELICMLVGERPGLVTAESMSAYITYKPRAGVPESSRTVVSNIHRQGTPAVEAGAHIAQLLVTMLEKKASGIDLKRASS